MTSAPVVIISKRGGSVGTGNARRSIAGERVIGSSTGGQYFTPQAPAIIEGYGPEFYADGFFVRRGEEVVDIIFYVTRGDPEQPDRHEVLRVHVRRSGFDLAHARQVKMARAGH